MTANQKFGRTFRMTLKLNDGGGDLIIASPFTCRFWIQRNTLSDLNRFSFDIYNLSQASRDRIFQDRFDITQNRLVTFEAGYDTLYRVAVGRIFEASSARNGSDIITRIEARDGSFDISTSQVFTTLSAGQTVADVLKYLIGQFPTLQLGAIGSYPDVLQRPVVLNGNTWELIKNYSNNQVYIDNGKVYALANHEVFTDQVHVVNDSTGILETPRRDEGFLAVSSLLETGVDLAQVMQITSTIQGNYDGFYKIIGLQHQGVISGAVNGPARSVFNLLAPNRFKPFAVVQPA